MMFQLDKEGTFLGYKGSRENLYVEENAFLGKKIDKVLPADIADRARQYINRALKNNDIQIFEYQLGINGELRKFESRMSPSGDDEVVAIIRDITESANPSLPIDTEDTIVEKQVR
jgi:hypothetical protein